MPDLTEEPFGLPLHRAPKMRTVTLDVASAIALAEGEAGSEMHGDVRHDGRVDELLEQCRTVSLRGQRAAIVARVSAFAASREAMRRIAYARLGVVAHAIAASGSEDLSALVDLGWAVLCASGAEDSFDLTQIARRASEDAGVPVLVVHGLAAADGAAGRAFAFASLPEEQVCRAFVGEAPAHARQGALRDSMKTGGAVLAERVAFALGSAFRDYAHLSGRKHDAFDKVPLGEAPIVLVGLGVVGEALVCGASELREWGYDVSAVHVTSLRPFPGARLVKALARTLAVTILEPEAEPLSHGGLLAREIKAAFTDALTWTPGFPGIGRVPKLFLGVTGPSIDLGDLAQVCENMLQGEQGRRSFSFTETEDALPRGARSQSPAAAVRFVLSDTTSADLAVAASAAAIAGAVGVRAQAIVATRGKGGVTVDLSVARDHAGGGFVRRPPRIVLAPRESAEASDAVLALVPGSVLAIVADVDDGRPVLADALRPIVRERRARILPLSIASDGDRDLALVASCAGMAVAATASQNRLPVDGARVAEVVSEHFRARFPERAAFAGESARRAYEAAREVLAGGRDGTEVADVS